MQEVNLIDNEVVAEPIVNNAPVIVNEVDINSLTIPSEDDLSRELGCDCRMNRIITFGVKETSYKCPNCPNNMKHICLYCLETCHKSHINNLPSYLFKSDLIDFQNHPCECAKCNHKTTVIENLVEDGMKTTDKFLKDDTCSGSVIIKNNSTSEGKYYAYVPYLECDDYKTEYLTYKYLFLIMQTF